MLSQIEQDNNVDFRPRLSSKVSLRKIRSKTKVLSAQYNKEQRAKIKDIRERITQGKYLIGSELVAIPMLQYIQEKQDTQKILLK